MRYDSYSLRISFFYVSSILENGLISGVIVFVVVHPKPDKKFLHNMNNSPYSVALYPLYGGVLHIIDAGLGLLGGLLVVIA